MNRKTMQKIKSTCCYSAASSKPMAHTGVRDALAQMNDLPQLSGIKPIPHGEVDVPHQFRLPLRVDYES
jgi:hypothetical protein